jgi:hypothetical protein
MQKIQGKPNDPGRRSEGQGLYDMMQEPLKPSKVSPLMTLLVVTTPPAQTRGSRRGASLPSKSFSRTKVTM